MQINFSPQKILVLCSSNISTWNLQLLTAIAREHTHAIQHDVVLLIVSRGFDRSLGEMWESRLSLRRPQQVEGNGQQHVSQTSHYNDNVCFIMI